jgi:hypothetical protein
VPPPQLPAPLLPVPVPVPDMPLLPPLPRPALPLLPLVPLLPLLLLSLPLPPRMALHPDTPTASASKPARTTFCRFWIMINSF